MVIYTIFTIHIHFISHSQGCQADRFDWKYLCLRAIFCSSKPQRKNSLVYGFQVNRITNPFIFYLIYYKNQPMKKTKQSTTDRKTSFYISAVHR